MYIITLLNFKSPKKKIHVLEHISNIYISKTKTDSFMIRSFHLHTTNISNSISLTVMRMPLYYNSSFPLLLFWKYYYL